MQTPIDSSHASPSARTLGFILLGGLAMRLLVWTWFAGVPLSTFDEREYSAIAVNLVEWGEFAVTPGSPTSLRPPVYPFLLAGVYRVFGLENYQAVRLLQIAIDLLTVVLVYRLASELYDTRVAQWAAGLCCFYPSLWGHNYLLLTEVLFTCLLCSASLLLTRSFREQRLALAAAGGVVMGLAALTRSVMWPFFVPFVLFLLAARHLPLARRVAAALTFTLCFAATLAPWVARNTRVQRTFTLIETRSARVWNWGLQHVETGAGSTDGSRAGVEARAEANALRQVLQTLVHKPWSVARRIAGNFFEFWRLDRELVAGAHKGHFGPIALPAVLLLAALVCGYYALLLFASILGVVMGPHPHRLAACALLLIVAHIAAIHTLILGHSRYHVPVMPLLAPFAASALVQGRRLILPQRRTRLCASVALCALFTVAWVTQFVIQDYPDFLTRGKGEIAAAGPGVLQADSLALRSPPRHGLPTPLACTPPSPAPRSATSCVE